MRKIFILSALALLAVSACTLTSQSAVIPMDEAKTKAIDFINNNLMQPGSEVTLSEISEENGMYKIVVNLPPGGDLATTSTYMTRDGRRFFPQEGIDIAAAEAETGTDAADPDPAPQPPANVSKQAKPEVELFVMSHCPYGTQIEKGFLPVAEALGDKIDYEIKFVDYAMHGEKEVDEQINQYCIQAEQNDKFIPYLQCFLEAGDGAGCLGKAGINKSQLQSCYDRTDKEYKIKDNFADQSTWKSGRFPLFDISKEDNVKYGITGSPGFVLNGAKVNTGRSPQALLTTICAGFEEAPAECDTKLDSATPAAGFGYNTGGSASAAECGS